MKQNFNVEGMTCAACSSIIEKSIGKLEGVSVAEVNLLTKKMTVEFEPELISSDKISKAVKKLGYKATLAEDEKIQGAKSSVVSDNNESNTSGLIASVVLLVFLMYITMGHMVGLPLPKIFTAPEYAILNAITQLLLTLPILILNKHFFTVGFKALYRLSPNMDSLIAVGSSAAFFYSVYATYMIGYALGQGNMDISQQFATNLHFEAAATVITLVSVGKYLEDRSKGKTTEALKKLMNLAPDTATVIRDGNEVTLSVSEIMVNDTLIIRPGEIIPVDGVISKGVTVINESALTGESIPVDKSENDNVMSGSVNMTGSFSMKAQKVGKDTTLSKIVELVEEAGNSKAPIARLADKISGVFVPIVIFIALTSAIVWQLLLGDFQFSLFIAISVLVISCPCALGLATPVAIMAASGRSASKGILIKSARELQLAAKIDTIVFDKTGTITQGKPQVTDVISFNNFSEEFLLAVARGLETPSEHPLAKAIVEYSKSNNIEPMAVESFSALPGKGVEAFIDNSRFFGGNSLLMKEKDVDIDPAKQIVEQLSFEGKTAMFFAKEKVLLGVIAVADTIKESSHIAIKELKELGYNIFMLTGDNKITANAVKKSLSIDNVIAEVLPEDKDKVIRKLKRDGKTVMMVGDGINDSPALIRADVGVAIGDGTDIAIESAGVILMKNDLRDVVKLLSFSKATVKIIKQNLFWAFFYNVIGIPIAAGLFYPLTLNPMIGAAAMSFSSLFVVFNALRLYKK